MKVLSIVLVDGRKVTPVEDMRDWQVRDDAPTVIRVTELDGDLISIPPRAILYLTLAEDS